jgi:hypothetical protein
MMIYHGTCSNVDMVWLLALSLTASCKLPQVCSGAQALRRAGVYGHCSVVTGLLASLVAMIPEFGTESC